MADKKDFEAVKAQLEVEKFPKPETVRTNTWAMYFAKFFFFF